MSPRFSIIPAGAVTDPRIEARDLQVLCLLGRHIDDLGWCRRSQVRMARELGCARSTVQASLDRLIAAEWVQKRVEPKGPKGDTAHSYRVRLDHDEGDSFYRDVAKIGRGRKRSVLNGQTENEGISQAGIPPADQSAPPRADPDRHPLPTYASAPVTTPVERDSRESAHAHGENNNDLAERQARNQTTFDALAVAWTRGAQGGAGAIGDATKALAAIDRLEVAEHAVAVDAAPRFLRSIKDAGRRFTMSIERYVHGRQFIHHPPSAKASPDDLAPVELKPFTAPLWLLMWKALNKARSSPENLQHRRRLLDTLDWIERGATMPAATVPPEAESSALVPIKTDSPEFIAWRDYAARVGLPKLPKPDHAPVIFAPAQLPPTLTGTYPLALPVRIEVVGQTWWWRYWQRIREGNPVVVDAGRHTIDALDRARRSFGAQEITAGPLPLPGDLAELVQIEPTTRPFEAWTDWLDARGTKSLWLWDRGPIWVPTEYPQAGFGTEPIETPDYDALEDISAQHNGEAA